MNIYKCDLRIEVRIRIGAKGSKYYYNREFEFIYANLIALFYRTKWKKIEMFRS